MNRTYYTTKPAECEKQKYAVIIRLEITEIEPKSEEEQTQYTALEFYVFSPYDENRIFKKVMDDKFGNDYENKLINEFNGAQMGLYPDAEMEQKIQRYKAFLQQRNELKATVERICLENGIL